jgi:hypothetical protein
VSGVVLAGVVAFPAVGWADAGATGRDFGEQVVTCARDMGFNGQHNPGVMHRGYAGWDPSHSC